MDTLEDLQQRYRAKFDEICQSLCSQYGKGTLASLSPPDRQEIVDEAMELAANWSTVVLSDGLPVANTALQKLLDELGQLGARLGDIQGSTGKDDLNIDDWPEY